MNENKEGNNDAKDGKPDTKKVRSGTPGLDAMLEYQAEDWLTEQPDNTAGHFERNSATLLIGPAGSGKTGIGLQFLFQYWLDPNEGEDCPPVLVSFDYAASGVIGDVKNHFDEWSEAIKSDAPQPRPKASGRPVTELIFRQAHIDPNLVVAQVRESILGKEESAPERLMLDGISEWLSSFEGSDREQVLEALLNGIFDARRERGNRIPLSLMISYEVEKDDPQRLPAAFGIPAQNIFVLKQVHIQESTRRVIYVAKAAGKNPDRSVREVRRDEGGRISIVASLDEFERVLSASGSSPASVSLQFFAENHAERDWSAWAIQHLGAMKPLKYKALEFGRAENSRTFEHIGGSGISPELRLISVDEWWLPRSGSGDEPETKKGADESTKGKTEEQGASDNSKLRKNRETPVTGLKNLWGTSGERSVLEGNWNDYWYFEIQKASPGTVNRDAPKKPIETTSLYAVPAYMDFGLFCVNLKQVEKWTGDVNEGKKKITNLREALDLNRFEFEGVLLKPRPRKRGEDVLSFGGRSWSWCRGSCKSFVASQA